MPPAWQNRRRHRSRRARVLRVPRMHMEPWDGPAGIVLTDGRYAACCLDRNGLRPARYVITSDRHITIASEVGVYDYGPRTSSQGSAGPRRDARRRHRDNGELLDTDDIDTRSNARPTRSGSSRACATSIPSSSTSRSRGRADGPATAGRATRRCSTCSRGARRGAAGAGRRRARRPSARWATTRRWPVLSTKVRSPFDYFRQQFAQVTNPPIDPLRERDRDVAADEHRPRIKPVRHRGPSTPSSSS